MTALAEAPAPPAPGTPEWVKLITASKVAGILGISPWDSPFSLWLKMKGVWHEQIEVDPDGPLARGTLLENGLLDWWVTKHPELPVLERQAYRTQAHLPGMAATLDGLAWNGLKGKLGVHALVEAKTAAKMENWGANGTDQVPPYYKAQVDFQFLMTPEARVAYVVCLGPYLDLREYVIPRNEERIGIVAAAALAFQQSLEDDAPPPLDDHEATFTALKATNPDIELGKVSVITDALAERFIVDVAADKVATAKARGVKSEILAAAGQNQYVATESGVRVARRQANRHGVSLYPLFDSLEQLDKAQWAALEKSKAKQASVTETTPA